MYYSPSSVFMTNKTPSGVRKHHNSTKPGTRKMGEMFFFFRWASSVLSESLTMVLAQTAAFYTEQCTVPSLFQQLPVLRQSTPMYWNYMASLRCHFVIIVRVKSSCSN